MPRVVVTILHADPGRSAGPLERLLGDARRRLADRHRRTFAAAGADEVRIVAGEPDGIPFGRRLAGLLGSLGATGGGAGLIVLGSGSVPLLRLTDARRFVAAAAARDRAALANNRYSGDAVAIACASELPPPPDLPSDNALPRWLGERAGWRVSDLAHLPRLGFDLDSPLDLALADDPAAADARFDRVRSRLAALREVAADPAAELVVAGRLSAATLRRLETGTACRVRALVEERGLRASSALAVADDARRHRPARPPRSVLGIVLERDGPGALGRVVSELGDAAVIDTRVLLAHRLGADERGWPPAEERFASDLLEPGGIADPWLRAATEAAANAAVPVLLGGHSLVGPGLSLALGLAARATRPGRG